MRSEAEINHAVETYADMIRRVCFYHLKNQSDTEDVFQNVFLKYMLSNESFYDSEHEKAWLLRVSINACKDYLKNFFRRNVVPRELQSETRCCLFRLNIRTQYTCIIMRDTRRLRLGT